MKLMESRPGKINEFWHLLHDRGECRSAVRYIFQAVALSKTVEDAFVVPILFDISAIHIQGPLAMFQGMSLVQ